MLKVFILPIMFLNCSLNAQETLYVTADRIVSPLITSPADITVIEEQELKKFQSADEILEKITDTSVTQSGPLGGNSSIFMRGTDSSHTLVVIDGIIMNDPSNPNRQFDLSKLSLNNIEKIEILKGSQGLLYGSNAIGGVIVITTKKADSGHHQTASFEAGSFQTRKIDFSAQSKINSTGISIGADYLTSEGFSAANDTQTIADRDGIKRLGFDTGITHKFNEQSSLEIKYRFFSDDIELDKSGGNGGDDPNDRQKTTQQFFKLQQNHNWSAGETKLYTNFSKHHRKLDNLADQYSAISASVISKGTIQNFGVNHTHYFNELWTQFFSLDYQKETDQTKHLLENFSLFTYARIDKEKNSFTIGGRIDLNKIFDHYFTFKTSYLRKLDQFALRGSLSTGYRSPSLNQLYDPVYGNKNLHPEKSFSRELGIESLNKIHFWQSNFFWTNITDRLSYHPVSFINQNSGKARIVGIENSYRWDQGGFFSPSLSLTALSTKDYSTGKELPRRPELKGQAGIDLHLKKARFNLSAVYQSKRADVDNAGLPVSLPDYTKLDLSYERSLDNHTSASLKIKNLLNKKFEEIYGYGNGGRSLTLGFEARY